MSENAKNLCAQAQPEEALAFLHEAPVEGSTFNRKFGHITNGEVVAMLIGLKRKVEGVSRLLDDLRSGEVAIASPSHIDLAKSFSDALSSTLALAVRPLYPSEIARRAHAKYPPAFIGPPDAIAFDAFENEATER